MHRQIDQAILDSTGPGIPASGIIAKLNSILMALDTFTPETNPNSTQKGSTFSHPYIPNKSTLSDVTALSDSQERCASRFSHSHDEFTFSDTVKSQRSVTLQRLVTLKDDVHPDIHTATTSPHSMTQEKVSV